MTGPDALTYNCSPAATAGPSPSGRKPKSARVIDLHCHVLNPSVEALVASAPQKLAEPAAAIKNAGAESAAHNAKLMTTTYRPKLTDIQTRLADMDAMGVSIQALSPSPTQYYYWADADLARQIVLQTNEGIAELCARTPERFVGLGSVALQDPVLAAQQADHAIRKLGLRGIEISSLVNGEDISDTRFAPFWAKVEELDALVFLHPLGTSLGPRLDTHYLSNTIGQPLETTISLSKMIFSGLFDRFPRLKVCAAHGGGYLPLYISRSDHAYAVRPEACSCRMRPSAYLKQIWFDTVVYDSAHLQRLVDVVGASQCVIGTDYPFDMGHYSPHELVAGLTRATDEEREAILAGNAARLLNLRFD